MATKMMQEAPSDHLSGTRNKNWLYSQAFHFNLIEFFFNCQLIRLHKKLQIWSFIDLIWLFNFFAYFPQMPKFDINPFMLFYPTYFMDPFLSYLFIFGKCLFILNPSFIKGLNLVDHELFFTDFHVFLRLNL